MISTYHGHRDIVRLLLDYGADVTIADCFGKKAVDRARDTAIARILERAENEPRSTHASKKPEVKIQSPKFNPKPQEGGGFASEGKYFPKSAKATYASHTTSSLLKRNNDFMSPTASTIQ